MPRTITEDDLYELELAVPEKGQSTEAMLRNRIDLVVGWANDPDVVLDEDLTRARLLCVAAEHSRTVGELSRSLDLAREAVASNDADASHGIPVLMTALFELGRDDEAMAEVAVARAKIREDPTSLDSHVMERIGEELAYFGRLDAAERWFALCVRTCERTDERGLELARSLTFRWAVRRRAGKAQDAMDLEAEAFAEARGWENPNPLLFREDEEV